MDQSILPTNPELSRYLDRALTPESPVLLVHWMDACFDSRERVIGKVRDSYQAGCMDVVCGYLIEIRDGFAILANSAYVRPMGDTDFRHVWNIPLSLIVKVEVMKWPGANVAQP